MDIRNIKHKNLRNFVTKNDPKGLPQERLKRITQIIGYLSDMQDIEEFFILTKWHAHKLTGDRKDTYSLMVTGNYRITFKHDETTQEIYDLDYEDYH